MKGVSYFIVSPRIGKLPNWPYFMQLVPRTILVGWNAELPRKVIVGDVHGVYTQHGVWNIMNRRRNFIYKTGCHFSLSNLKRHRWRNVSADNVCDEKKILIFKSGTFIHCFNLQFFRKPDLPPSPRTVEKIFLALRRTEDINLLRSKQLRFCPFPFQFEEGGRFNFRNFVGFPTYEDGRSPKS